MARFNDGQWLTTESVKQWKTQIRSITSIGELSQMFNNIYQELYANIDRFPRDLQYFADDPKENIKYSLIVKKELNRIRKIFGKTKKYIKENNLSEHYILLYIIIDQLLDLFYEVDIVHRRFWTSLLKRCFKSPVSANEKLKIHLHE